MGSIDGSREGSKRGVRKSMGGGEQEEGVRRLVDWRVE